MIRSRRASFTTARQLLTQTIQRFEESNLQSLFLCRGSNASCSSDAPFGTDPRFASGTCSSSSYTTLVSSFSSICQAAESVHSHDSRNERLCVPIHPFSNNRRSASTTNSVRCSNDATEDRQSNSAAQDTMRFQDDNNVPGPSQSGNEIRAEEIEKIVESGDDKDERPGINISIDRSGLFNPQMHSHDLDSRKEPETPLAKQLKALIRVIPTSFETDLMTFWWSNCIQKQSSTV